MAWVDATDYFTRADDARERQLGPVNPRDLLLMIAADRDPANALPEYEHGCEVCGCGIEPGRALCTSCFSNKRKQELALKRSLGNRCIECGKDISDRGGGAVRCVPCAKAYHKERQLVSQRRRSLELPVVPRVCQDCPADISDRGHNAKTCVECGKERARKATRAYQERKKMEAAA